MLIASEIAKAFPYKPLYQVSDSSFLARKQSFRATLAPIWIHLSRVGNVLEY